MNFLRFTHALIVPGEEYYKNKVKEIPCRPWGEMTYCSLLMFIYNEIKKKQKPLLSSQHSQKYEKQNTKGVIMYIKRKEHILSLGFSTIIYCTNLDKLLHNLRPSFFNTQYYYHINGQRSTQGRFQTQFS